MGNISRGRPTRRSTMVTRYNGPGDSFDAATSVVVSPGGDKVFVTGQSVGATSGPDYATIAYNAATGARLWAARYNGPGNGYDAPAAMAISPTGRTVYVTGASGGADYFGQQGRDYATIAYNAATGARLWIARYNGPANSYDLGKDIAVSPAGNTVFVTGQSAAAASGDDYATIAYNAATGARLWAARYTSPSNQYDSASAVTVGPGGNTVYVTGSSKGTTPGMDYATIAYRAATGAQLWAERYNGPGNNEDIATAMAISPDGSTVYVTGSSAGTTPGMDYATIAYRTATGARLWTGRYDGPAHRDDLASSVAVSPRDGKVFVTGESMRVISDNPYQVMDYATIAYHG